MEEVKPQVFDDVHKIIDNMKECFSKVKVYKAGEEESGKVVDVTEVVKGLFENIVDYDTKNLINKLSTSTTAESLDVLKEYHQKQKEKEKGKEEVSETDVSELVNQERKLREKLNSLSASERKEYYAQLYQIPTDKDVHAKLDLALERLEDLSSEVAILRRHIASK
jgi:hypothetical protein